jgi:cation-transporting ATPase E
MPLTETTPKGLTAAEVAERTARGEINRVRRSNAAEYLDILARNTLTLFNALVVPAALALLALGDWRGGAAVSGMAIANIVLGLVQEVRAKRHLDQLTLLADTPVRAVRDGAVCEVHTGDVVRGDRLLLSAGEPVVADGTVCAAHFLEVDEALLTGESDPVPRRVGEPVLSGSFCVAGEGAYMAERVGAAAFAQRTAAEARTYRYTASPLQESINRLIRILTGTAVVLCAGYVVVYSARDLTEGDLFQMIAATITSMVPQGLVLMATLAFVLGAVRLAARGAVVQRLEAVESMAAVDTLCLDKTGTLTTNRLHLERLAAIDPDLPEEAVRDRLRLFAAASPDRGSKTVAALGAALGPADVEVHDCLPFKSQNRYSAVRIRADGKEHVLVLGACEALAPHLLPPISSLGREVGGEGWEPLWQDLMQRGLRLLLFAEAPPEGRPGRTAFDGSLEGFRLRPLVLVALGDEVRPGAGKVLEELAGQCITFKVLSGDNAETVRATVAPLADDSPSLRALAGPVVTGAELEAAADAGALIETGCVFGRVSPWQKVEIVAALKGRGRRVAMIGDGVNDVLPLKNAHLGIAMGEGSRASKTVSGLVLESNDFGLLPATLDEGRTIVRNLRRAAKLFLVKNTFTLVLIVAALGFFGLPFPYLSQQVTLLNLLTIGVPAFVLMLHKEAVPGPSRPGFLREVGSFVLRTGLVIGVAGVVLLLLGRRWHEQEVMPARVAGMIAHLGPPLGQGPFPMVAPLILEQAQAVKTMRTLLLSALVLLGVTTLLRALTDGEVRRPAGDDRLRLLALAAVPAYLAVMYVPALAYFFELQALTWRQWGHVLLVAGPAWAVLVLSDRVLRLRAVAAR